MKSTSSKNLTYLITLNSLIAVLIALRYFDFSYDLTSNWLGMSFLVSSVISQMFLLTFVVSLPLFLFLGLPKRWFTAIVAIYLAIYLGVLYIDTIVFEQYKFHLNPAILELVLAGGIVDFPLSTWFIACLVFVGLVLAQLGLFKLSRAPWSFKNKKPLRKLAFIVFISLLSSNLLHIWGAANVHPQITNLQPYLPAFYPATANGFMNKHGWVNHEKLEQQKSLANKKSSMIHYPKQAIQTEAIEEPVNIMFILIDSWRFDSMNAENSPNIWALAQQGVSFNQHLSSGNSTTTGVFGFFYGLHGTYWHNILDNLIPPIFITRLQELNYQLGIFASAQLYRPEFNNTIFATVKGLRIESDGNSPSARDRDSVNDWQEWHAKQDSKKPVFSFLFLDSAHGYNIPEDMELKYTPDSNINYINLSKDSDATPYLNRHRNSVYYMDSLVGEVIEQLKDTNQLDNTLIIISGDHGQEVNDTLQNNWGHNSNFTDFQIKVPMILAGPSVERFQTLASRNVITHHTDIAPTLLKNYLGVLNPIKDFASGVDWLNFPENRPWILSSAYNKFALVTQDLIFEVDPQGRSKLVDKMDKPVKNKAIPQEYIRQLLDEISYFNK